MTAPTFLPIVGGYHHGQTIGRDQLHLRLLHAMPSIAMPHVPDSAQVKDPTPIPASSYSRRCWTNRESGFYIECASPVEMSDDEVLSLIFDRGLDRERALPIENETGAKSLTAVPNSPETDEAEKPLNP